MKTNGKLKRLIKEETRRVLLEVTMEQAEARFNSKAFLRRASLEGVEPDIAKSNILKHVPQDVPERFKADALWWAITIFIKSGRLQVFTQSKNLEIFFQIKEAGKSSILTKPDINQIQSWDELEEVVTQAKPAWQPAWEDFEGNMIYEDDNWKVFVPKDARSACIIGKDSGWCTSNDASVFNDYYNPEDPLIIFKSKKNPKDVYQLHYGQEEFKGRKNKDISIGFFKKLNDIVKSLAGKLPENVIKLANEYIYKPLEDGGFKVITSEGIFYINAQGERHRLDGPAVEDAYGYNAWYIEGVNYTEQDFNQKVKELKAQQNLREHFMRYL